MSSDRFNKTREYLIAPLKKQLEYLEEDLERAKSDDWKYMDIAARLRLLLWESINNTALLFLITGPLADQVWFKVHTSKESYRMMTLREYLYDEETVPRTNLFGAGELEIHRRIDIIRAVAETDGTSHVDTNLQPWYIYLKQMWTGEEAFTNQVLRDVAQKTLLVARNIFQALDMD